jgi:replicative DNA helicase Mcm
LSPSTIRDDAIDKKIHKLSKDPDILHRLIKSFAPNIHGLEIVKEAILYNLVGGVKKKKGETKTRGIIHVLIIGDPSTGKSQLLDFASSLAEKSVEISGKGVNLNGLSATVTIDSNGQPLLFPGALSQADQGLLLIDKIEKMNPEDRAAITTAMEQNTFSIAKNGIVTTLNTRVSVLAAANPTLGRYNPYQTLAQNINLPIPLLSCFDLIFIIRDQPDTDKDSILAEKILEIDQHNYEKKDQISFNLLKKYIEYAKKIESRLSLETKILLKDFYIKMRQTSRDEDAISITVRQLESLVRLAEARAKLHLRKHVTRKDATAAISIMNACLRQVGIDPITKEYDIDVFYTGRPTVLNSHLLKVIEVFAELEQHTTSVRDDELYYTLFEKHNMNRTKVQRLLQTLLREGIIYSPRPGYYKRAN